MWNPWIMGLGIWAQKPTRTARRLYDIMQDLEMSESSNRLAVTYNGNTLISGDIVFNMLLRYSNFVYTQSDLVGYVNPDTGKQVPGGYIMHDWDFYNRRNAQNLFRMLDALYAEYNPIDNYSMIEESLTGEKQDAHKTTPHGTVTNKTTNTGAGIDTVGDGSISGTSENVTSYQNADNETTYDNTKSFVFDDTEKAGYHKTDEHYTKRSGNIGVTTSAQMIEQELKMRVMDIVFRYVDNFIKSVCYYVG